MTIRFIYFDLGNVLLQFSHDLACEQVGTLAGLTAGQVREVVFDTGLADRYEVGELSTAEFHAQFGELTKTNTDMDQFALAFSDIFTLHTRNVPLVAGLRTTGNRLGILSNTCAAHWRLVTERFPSLISLFDPIVTSYTVKSMKPDSAIYERATTLVQLAPHEIFFTDDREENVQGAIEYGWQARRFTTARQLGDDLESLGVIFNR